MYKIQINRTFAVVAVVLAFAFASFSQTPLIKKTSFKSEAVEFGAGGTLSVNGAPNGSITIESWAKNEIEVTAEIEVEAANESDLAQLSEVNGFMIDQDFNTTKITSVGTFDKDYMKRKIKKFPKRLLGMPFRIDYKIKVPRYCDINVTGGRGDFVLSGVDGEIFVKFVSTRAKMTLVGGSVQATFGEGTVDVEIPTRSWRGRFADIQLATGKMNIHLPLNLSAEIDVNVLRTGQIENSFAELKPRSRNVKFTERSIAGKAGNGGVALKFSVGDGDIKIAEYKQP